MKFRGDRLKKTREQHGLSQADFAEQIDVSKSQIGRYENNHSSPTAEVIARMAKELRITSDYLLNLTDEAQTPLNGNRLTSDESELIENFRRGGYLAVSGVIMQRLTQQLSERGDIAPVDAGKGS